MKKLLFVLFMALLPIYSTNFTANASETSGVPEEYKSPVTVTPNPFSNVINIHVDNQGMEYTVRVYNTLGQLVMKTKSSEENITIDTKNWASGVYILRITLNGEDYDVRIVKRP